MIDFDDYNAGVDVPDSRDINAEDFLDMVAELPSKCKVADIPFLNQGSIGACTVFGTSGALFAISALDATRNGTPYNQPYDPWTVWDKAKERGASDRNGWSLQGAVQLILDMKHSLGYALVASPGNKDPFLLKRAIANGYAVATGSQYGDWGKIIQTGEYSDKSTPSGHIYYFNEYDDNHVFSNGDIGGFFAPNSWNGVGSFWMSYKQIGVLYSTYMQLDPSDVQAMKDFRNIQAKQYAEKSRLKKIWNGERGDNTATAEEIRIMLLRAIDIMGVRSRKYWATTFEDKILRGKGLLPVWNEKEAMRNATDNEIAIMFTRAVRRDSKLTGLSLTRFQIASVLGRDF